VRAQHDVDAIAITGSVGKTTTKNLVSHVLGAGPTLFSSP
jgi:UDP-N-acetylmuramyl pentapeptide synthase